MIFVYLVSFNPETISPSLAQIHTLIEKSREIDSWYYAFSGTYLIKSSTPIVYLSATFRNFFGEGHFIISHVVPDLIGGSLPQPVWDWANTNRPALAGIQQ